MKKGILKGQDSIDEKASNDRAAAVEKDKKRIKFDLKKENNNLVLEDEIEVLHCRQN